MQTKLLQRIAYRSIISILRGCWTGLSPIPSVGLSVRWVNCGKTADWIWMPFRVVSGVCRGMGVL